MMAAEAGSSEEAPRVEVAGDGPACGKFVAKDGDRDLYCDLPAGHPDTVPCSARVEDVTLDQSAGAGAGGALA